MGSNALRHHAMTLFYFCLWFSLNALFNVYNKRVLDVVGLPWIMTFVQLSTGFVLVLPLWAFGFREMPSLSRKDWNWLLPLGFYHALSSAGGVHAINSGAVSTFQVLKAMEPIVACILAAVLYKQVFHWQVYATVVVVVFGVIFAFWSTDGDASVNLIMLFGTLISIVGAAMRSLSSKQKMKQNMSPANVFAMMNATSLVMLLPFTLLDVAQLQSARDRIRASPESPALATLIWWAVMSGVFFYTNNEVAFYALSKVHPITHAVANIVRRVLIILASVVFLGDSMTLRKIIGASIAISGVFLYSLAKYYWGQTIQTSVAVATSRTPHRSNGCSTKKVVWFVGLGFATVFQATTTTRLHSMVFIQPMDMPTSFDTLEAESPQALPQPLGHFLRVNSLSVDEIAHVFNRMDELNSSNITEFKAEGKVLCAVGLDKKAIASVADVWVRVLRGVVGHVAPNHSVNPTSSEFSSCDAIVSAGNSYRSAALWAYKSPVPVINLYNSDGYSPQAAVLFAYNNALSKKTAVEKYSTTILAGESLIVDVNVVNGGTGSFFSGYWAQFASGTPAFEGFAEVSRLLRFKFKACRGKSCGSDVRVPFTYKGAAPAHVAAVVELALAKFGKLPMSYRFPGIRCEPGVVVGAKVAEHDNNFAYSENGSILFALEWERVTKVKYNLKHNGFREAADVASRYALSEFDIGTVDLFVVTRSCQYLELGGRTQPPGEKDITAVHPGVPIVFREQLFVHAVHSFLDSPFESAVVLAMHGAGSEPYDCAVYLARRGMQPIVLQVCDKKLQNIIGKYTFVSASFAEVVAKQPSPQKFEMDWAGTFMGYAGLGGPLPCLDRAEEELFKKPWDALEQIKVHCSAFWNTSAPESNLTNFPRNLPLENQRDAAYAFQELFERTGLRILNGVKDALTLVDGIVVTGGAGLNVKLTQRLRNDLNMPVWVPSAPGDNGVGVGGAWSVCQPPRDTVPLQYHGLPLFDKDDLPKTAELWGSNCEKLGMGEEAAMRLATLLAVENQIVAFVIGRQEFGPRALSHRSLVAYPGSIEIRERMNALKFRQFYRPTCPTLVEEFVGEMFVEPEKVNSPFMSFAAKLQEWVGRDLPAVRHFDGTARPQLLSKKREPFVHSTLMSIPKVRKGAKPVVINTSFNIKGQPIINTLLDTLYMLCDRPQLDYAFVDGYLFKLVGNSTHPECDVLKKKVKG